MQSALLDTGALVAIIKLLKHYGGRFLTTWPVIAEACSFMPDRLQKRVLDWIAAADVEVVSIDDGLDFMRTTMDAYSDLPCDFADASLVYAAFKDRSRFTLIPGGK